MPSPATMALGLRVVLNPLRVIATGEGETAGSVMGAMAVMSEADVGAALAEAHIAMCGDGPCGYSKKDAPVGVRFYCKPLRVVVFGDGAAVEFPMALPQLVGLANGLRRAAKKAGYAI